MWDMHARWMRSKGIRERKGIEMCIGKRSEVKDGEVVMS